MNKVFTWMKTLVVALLVTASFTANSQSYPFPQNVDYTYGLKPTGVTSADALAAYENWKTNFVTSSGACGYRRVIFDYYPGTTRGKTDRSVTVSEGIAYGMLLSAYAGDRSLFDDLWNYYKSKTNGSVMHWKIENCNVTGPNGASDAELDAAMALIVASHQWQSDIYLNDAKNLIRIIRQKEINGNYVLKPGDQFGGDGLTCPSYFSPAYYRVFKQYDAGQGAFWDNVAAKGYQIINAASGPSGLVPDWCTSSGGVSSEAAQLGYEDAGKNFIFDAIRTPFRSGIDYLWHGNADAKAYCAKISTWLIANHGSASQIGSKYGTKLNNNDGQKLGSYKNNTFIGCFGVGVMGSDLPNGISFLNSCASESKNTNPGYGEYFNASFKVLSLFVMTGNFYLPPPDQCDGPSLGADKSLCQSNPLILDAGITGRTYVWKKNGSVIANQTAKTLSVSAPGLYEVVATDPSGCVRRDNINVFEAALKADFTYKAIGTNLVLTSTSSGGISNYSWAFNGTPITTNASEVSHSVLQAGSYPVKLTITNAGFGCTQTATITKNVVIGNGVGVAFDDFNNSDYVQPWANAPEFKTSPKVYCSRELYDAGGPVKDCPGFPCGSFPVELLGTTDIYKPFGMTFVDGSYDKPLVMDISATPYVNVKLRSTKAMELGIGLAQKYGTEEVTSKTFVKIPANKDTVISLDFTTIVEAWSSVEEGFIEVDHSKVVGLQFIPYEKMGETFKATITIDWITVGAKTLPSPEFKIKMDELGFPIYEDPDGDKVYQKVSSWNRNVNACDGVATLKALTCTADQIKWYSGKTQIGTGETLTGIGAGKYYVELINAGGITRDSVIVSSSQIAADFTYAIEDKGFGIRTFNSSTGYHKWVWNYGATTTNPDLSGNTTWDEGYMYYDKEGTYKVTLTVTDTVCNVSKVATKDVVIKCSDDTIKFKYLSPTITDKKIKYCGGSPLTVKIDSAHASYLGWYGFDGANSMSSTETVTFTPTFSNWLKVEAENACKLKSVDSVYIDYTPAPVASIDSVKSLGGSTYGFVAKWIGDSVTAATKYKWSIDGGTPVVTKNSYYQTTFTGGGAKEICLTVENICGAPTTKSCKTVSLCEPVAAVGVIQGKGAVCPNEASVVYTITPQAGMTYSWTVPTGATITAGATTNSITVKFGTTGGKVVAKVTDACATPGFKTAELTVAVGASASPAFTKTVTGKKADFAIATPDANATYNWVIDGTASIGTTATKTFTAPGTYKVKATANTTCGSASDSSTVCISITASDVSAITASAATVCAGSATPITYSVAKITGATYTWTVPTGATKTETAESVSVVYGATAVSGNVTVAVANECTTPAISVSSAVVVNKKPAPAFTAPVSGKTVSPSITTVDPNATYTWAIDGTSKTGSSTTYTFTAPGTYKVKVTAENSCGSATDSTTVCIGITASDLGAITASASSVCADGKTAVTYNVPVFNGATYTWTVPSGATKTGTAESISVIYSATAVSGKVSVSVSSACTTPAVSATSAVTVAKPATATVVANSNGVDGLTAEATPSGDVTTYSWTVDNSPVAGTTAKLNAVVADGSHTVCVSVSNAVCPASAPVCATVNVKNNCTNKVGDIGTVDGSLTVCENTNGTYSVAPVTNATIYTWSVVSGGATIVPNGTSASITFATSDAVIKLVADNAEQCGTKTTQFTVKVGKKPSAAFTLTQDMKLISVSATDLTASSYAWSFGDGSNGSGSNQTHTYADFGNYTVSLTVSSASCPGDVTSTQDVKLAECSTPVLALTSVTKNESGLICSSLTDLVFTALPAVNPNVKSYEWVFPNGETKTSMTNQTTIRGYNKGSGEVFVTAKGACDESKSSIMIDMVQTISSSTADFNTSIDKDTITSATFAVTDPAPGVNYIWTDNGVEFGDGDTVVTKSYDAGSVRKICLSVSNSCSSNSAPKCKDVKIEILGLEDELNDYTTSVYPTVTANEITISLGGKLSGEFNITITSMIGKVVQTETMYGSSIKDIDVSSLAGGMYIVTIEQGAQRISKRFAKH